MYREVIEHPLSLPPMIKRHLDLTSGRDRGRIYRILPDGFTQRALPRLGTASTDELVATLAHKNGWHRETARGCCISGAIKAPPPRLRSLPRPANCPRGACTRSTRLRGSKRYAADVVLAGLADADPRVRSHAVRLAETVINDAAKDPAFVREKLLQVCAERNGSARRLPTPLQPRRVSARRGR